MEYFNINCPLCKEKTAPLFKKNSCQIMFCEVCDYEFINVGDIKNHVHSVYDDAYFEAGISGYTNYVDNEKVLTTAGEKYAKLIEKYLQPGKIFDIGAAAGFLLKGFINKGWTGKGIEPNIKMAVYAKKNLGINVTQGTIEEYESDEKYDLITMIQVIAHFYDLEKAIRKANYLTKKGGFLLIETWDKNSLTAKLFGSKWHEYNPPSVVRWLSLSALKKYLTGFGFKPVLAKHPVKWISGKQGKNIIAYNLGNLNKSRFISKSINLIPDGLRFPYLGDDLFYALFQKVK